MGACSDSFMKRPCQGRSTLEEEEVPVCQMPESGCFCNLGGIFVGVFEPKALLLGEEVYIWALIFGNSSMPKYTFGAHFKCYQLFAKLPWPGNTSRDTPRRRIRRLTPFYLATRP